MHEDEAFTRRLRDLAEARYGPGRGWRTAFHAAVVDEGIDITYEGVRAWLAGKSRPSRDRVATVDHVLDADGELVALFGLAESASLERRFTQYDERLAKVEAALALLARRRRGGS